MSEESSLDGLTATLVGAVLFSLVIGGVAVSYNPLPAQVAAATAELQAAAMLSPGNVAAQPVQTATPLPSPTALPATATPSPEPTSSPTRRPTHTPTAIPTAPPTPTAELTDLVPEPEDHYWFERPIAASGRNFVSRFYPYGSTAGGRYQVHHGVEFENPTGTPIMAVGSGRVVVAGSDDEQVYGLFPDFYGKLIVIEHDRTLHDQTVYTLYGHVNTVRVDVGQRVDAGQVIGEVGETGIALGPHLHMEVRVGANAYDATRNPELWIRPFQGHGTIAGRALDTQGNYTTGALISLYDDEGNWLRETETYGDGANPDDDWRENFVFGDLPAGRYVVQYAGDTDVYATSVEVEAGKTALAIIQLAQ